MIDAPRDVIASIIGLVLRTRRGTNEQKAGELIFPRAAYANMWCEKHRCRLRVLFQGLIWLQSKHDAP
jgi:hypothetical protein